MRLSRRHILGGVVAGYTAAFPMINRGMFQAQAATTKQFSRRVVDLVREAQLLDMLALIKLDWRDEYPASPLPLADAKAFKDSGIAVIHLSDGLEGPSAYEDTLKFLASWQGFVGRNPETFRLVGEFSDIAKAKQERRVAVIMGLQNSEHFRSVGDVKRFHQLGQRCSQLTYNSQNLIGSGCTDRVDGGVSDYGAQIVAEMNKVGMLIDVSHCGDRTTLDAITLSKQPIAITHSNCRAINNHPRLKTDEAIMALAKRGGVMGITGVRNFVRGQEPTTVVHIVDHIDHVVKIAGIDHVGIGSDSDLDGYDDMPSDQLEELRSYYKSSYAFRGKLDTDGFDSPLKYYNLTEELVRRRYSNTEIKAILGGNFERLLKQVWTAGTPPPIGSDNPSLDGPAGPTK
jgi:membrane dipeptidase